MKGSEAHRTDRSPRARHGPNPLRVLILVLGLVIAIEAAIMVVLPRWVPTVASWPALPLIDAVLLAAVLAPALWILVVRPLKSLSEQRGMLLSRVFEAQEQERIRMARDLHDGLGQQLTAVLLSLRAAEDGEQNAKTRECLQLARRVAGESVESVRRLARGLAPVALMELGLRAAVERLCEDFADAARLEIVRKLGISDERMPANVEIAIYRVIQEALTNVSRHSGARCVVVQLVRDSAALELSIADDGKGIAAGDEGTGLGLQGMRERITLLDGTFRVARAGALGTIVTARIPRVFPP